MFSIERATRCKNSSSIKVDYTNAVNAKWVFEPLKVKYTFLLPFEVLIGFKIRLDVLYIQHILIVAMLCCKVFSDS